VSAQVARLGVQRVRLAKLLRRSQPPGEAFLDAVVQAAARMGLVRAPRVMTTDLDCSPFVCGIVRPTLVLPRELADTLAAGDLAQVVAHELAHVQRRDLAWGWIPEIARIVYFFHPVAHWAARRVRLERELACDQRAMMTSGRGPAEYAETLVRVLSVASSPSLFRTAAAEGAP
jgi:beta-lactamase regulating signal transducer with metallopeptidase domain